jgi:hypothetical protein
VIVSAKKMVDHHIKILPCLLGENASNVQAIQSIQWAQESKKALTEILKNWPAQILDRKAKEAAEENA